MIVSVVVDDAGAILAIGPAPDVAPEYSDGAPTHHAFTPLAGQRVVTAELPDELNTAEAVARLYETHQLDTRGETASFVARG